MISGVQIIIPKSVCNICVNRTLTLLADKKGLCQIILPQTKPDIPDFSAPKKGSAAFEILTKTSFQISQYLQGMQVTFTESLYLKGTIFQQKIWNLIKDIPYGKTKSYKDLALQLGDANKARAVGNCANKNPLPLIIPCHRVIGSNGSLTGFAGGLDLKKNLLRLEGIKTKFKQ